MALVKLNLNPTPRQLNQFGILWLICLSIVGALLWWRLDSLTIAGVLWAVAIIVPVIGWVCHPVMRWAFIGLTVAAFPVGFVISHLIMAGVYYGVLTPIGLIMRIVGYDPMQRRYDRQADSYWQTRNPQPPAEQYFKQY